MKIKKENIRIVHIITTLERGGAQRILSEVIKNKKHNREYRHIVISLTSEKGFSKEIENYAERIYYLNGKNIISFPALIFQAFLLIRSLKPDLIQSWLYHADFTASFLGLFFKNIPILWTVHHASYSLKYESFHSKLIVYLLSKLSYYLPIKIIYCSKYSFDIHNKLGYSKSKSKIVMNGIDMNKFRPNKELGESFRASLNIKEKEFLIGFIGRYDPNKGINCFLKTAKQIKNTNNKNIKFLLCGNRMNKNNKDLVSEIKNLNLIKDVILLGEKRNMESIYNAIDLLICTSLTESFGLVAVEALACGKKVISSDLPALREIIEEENLIEPNNYLIFAKKSINLMKKDIKQKLSEERNIKNSVLKKYNIDNTVRGYYEIYKDIL
tara:strand:+ start:7371 stop:8519 length:1149 start_codon:yes stop_codon:yes gene_type:complete